MRLNSRTLQFCLLAIAAMVALYARMILSPLQETMRTALSLTDNQMAVLQGPALGLPMVLLAIPLGILIDRCSRARLLQIFAVCNLAATLLTAFAPDFTVLVVARGVIGFTATATAIIAFALLGDLVESSKRGRASMIVVIGQVGGMSAAFALGGLALAHYPSDPEGWRWATLWLSAPIAIVMLLLTGMREPMRSRHAGRPHSVTHALAEIWLHRTVVWVLAGLVMAEIAAVIVPVWTVPSLSRRFGLSPQEVGTVMSVAMLLSGILGPLSGGFLADVCQRTGGPRRTLLAQAALALLSVPMGFYALAPNLIWSNILLVIFKTLVGALLVMSVALITITAPGYVRGLALGVMAASNNLFAVALAPLAVSLLSGALGGPAMIGHALACVCVATGLCGAILFACGRRHLQLVQA